jgi:hypothetical protein
VLVSEEVLIDQFCRGGEGGGMEADEIRVVLARASELHAKISEAIERALKTEFQRSTSSRSLDSNFSSVLDRDESGRFDRDSDKSASVGGDGNAEARTLGLIRDALETLEEQLEALQVDCSILIRLSLCILVFCGIFSCGGSVSRVLVSWILDSVSFFLLFVVILESPCSLFILFFSFDVSYRIT